MCCYSMVQKIVEFVLSLIREKGGTVRARDNSLRILESR
jgi:hypothetical protein